MSATPTITILYSCNVCGLVDRPVAVPERGPADDVVAWVRGLGPAIERDHGRASPLCTGRHVDLKIPIAHGSGRVGEAQRQ